jgi:pimeloyl-ACP methyl ester carboxylesterase
VAGQASGEQIADLGEIELAYETFGDPSNPAMLLIMGLGAQMIFWPNELCEMLAERGFFVIRFDNRDVGRSTILTTKPPTFAELVSGQVTEVPYRLEDLADDATHLLDHLGIDSAHIVGASMGGMIAQTFAIRHPGRTLTLTSIMSTTGDRSVGSPTQAAMAVLTTAPPTDRDGYVEATIRGRGVIGTQPPDEARTRDLAERAFDRGYHPDGTARQIAAIAAGEDRTPHLRELNVPAVVIHGSEDPLITRSGGEATAAAIPGAELVILDGMGHDMPPAYVGRVADAIAALAQRATAS